MFSFVLGIACATSVESIDIIKIRGGSSCSSGSCSGSVFAEATKSSKVEVVKKQEVATKSCDQNTTCAKKSKFKIFKKACR